MTLETRSSAFAALAALLLGAPAGAQVQGTLATDPERLQGTHPGGSVLLYTPDPVQLGSSVSHWDPTATPNLLMEPAINSDLPFLGLDVTPALMEDVGWTPGTMTFNVFSLDEPGVGFTDPRPFPGAPGNGATTLGEARVNVFNAALAAWGDTLASAVPSDILVSWQPLPCMEGGGAALAGASTLSAFRDHPSFPSPGVWFHSSLAEALAGEDLSGPPDEGGGDILILMNSAIDEECLGPGTGWYYGLDGNDPANQIDQAPVVLHELGHGLGFANFSDEDDGALLDGLPSVFDLFTFDTELGKSWDEMTDGERLESAVNVRKVVWSGANVTAAAETTLAPGTPELTVTAPAGVAGIYEIGTATFGPALTPGGVTGDIVCMRDGVGQVAGDTNLDGCSAATNPGALAGNIALVDRGGCNFTDKVLNAQAAGAAAVIVANNAGDNPITLGGTPSAPVTIPAASIGAEDGRALRGAACPRSSAFLTGDRFQVTATWTTPQGNSGTGKAIEVTEDTTLFYFFNPDNIELVVKVLNACDTNSERFWVFAGGLTNVEVELVVTDTDTGVSKPYTNPLGQAFQPIQDVSAFDTCP